jgi:membrane glycosyltransferase
MSLLTSGRRQRREVVLVPEPVKPDGSIQRIKKIRDHRVQKMEAELLLIKSKCAASRTAMAEARDKVMQAQIEADQHWQQAKADFQSMIIDSKEFVARKFRHQKLKLQVAVFRNDARECVSQAKVDRAELREAKKELQNQRLKVEKLAMLRDLQLAELARLAA